MVSKQGVISMSEVRFEPWVGERYELAELYGLRVLLLGESHYGKGDEDSFFTRRVVKKWGQEKRHRFFTIIARFILHQGRKGRLTGAERREFWDKVAFYNYVQEIVGRKARIRPTRDMWKRSEQSFFKVLQDLKPDLVVVLGKQLGKKLPASVKGITFCKVDHPSSGFRYQDHLESLRNAIATARKTKGLAVGVR